MLKKFKINASNYKFSNKRRFDELINFKRVVIEHVFGAIKNQWRILKNFNMKINRATTTTLAYCIVCNFCEIYSK